MMRDLEIHPSLLSADFSNLSKAVAAVQDCAAAALHCDVMDGRFVPNITFGPLVVKAVRSLTSLPLCCHLMIVEPERYIEPFAKAGANEITVHTEACTHLHGVLQQIKAAGVRRGVALNPATPLCVLENVIHDIDAILIMTVNPGFGGQSFIETMLPKITEAKRMIDEAGVDVDIAVDGGIDVGTAPRVVRAGANVLIAGTAVFGSELPPSEACSALKLTVDMASASKRA